MIADEMKVDKLQTGKTGIYGIGTRNDVALYGRRLY